MVFTDYKDLALHIAASKNGHRGGKKWAAKYLMNIRALSRKENHNRIELTEEDRENKLDTIRHLSGKEERVMAICPQCKQGHRESLPVEFTQSSIAWRVKNCLVVMCEKCR
jgi:hypothetical protein